MSKDDRSKVNSVTSRRFYDAYSRGYAAYLKQHTRYFHAVEKLIFEEAGKRKNVALLDVGTGTGERLQRVVSEIRPHRTFAIDESPEMAALAQENCPSAEVLAISLTASEFTSSITEKFDIATCLSNVLGHIPKADLVSGLKQVRNLLKPGGVFICDVNNRYNSVHYGLLNVARNFARDFVLSDGGDFMAAYKDGNEVFHTPVHIFSPSEISGLLREAGFNTSIINYRDYSTGRKRSRFGGSIVVKAVRS